MSGTDTIGSLVIDLRANVAQLRVDMDAVKDTIQKSSREMASQMKSDMAETRGILALVRDDFGISIPREMRTMIASSELVRTAVLGLKDVIVGIAAVNLGVEAFTKIREYIEASSKAAAEEAKYTYDTAIAAERAVDATVKRAEQLALIGKGEEDRAAIQRAFFEEEIKQNTIRLQGLQSVLAARMAILASYDAQAKATPDRAASAEAGIDEGGTGQTGLSSDSGSIYAKFVQEHKGELDALNKAIDDANAGIKTSEVQLADFEKGLGISRLKNEEDVALAVTEARKKSAEDGYQAGKIGLDQYIATLMSTTDKEGEITLQGLYDRLEILNQDPSRNKEKIEQTNTEIQIAWIKAEQAHTDAVAKGVEARKKLAQEEAAMAASAAKGLIDSNKDHGLLPSDLATSMMGGKPQLNPDMIGAATDRFAGNFKDAAAQGKLLEKAMDDLLTPMDKFRIEQQEIEILKEKFKDYPEAVKALNLELLKANPEFQKLQEASAEFGKDLANELDNLILKGESFHDFLVNIAKDIEEIALKALLLKPLEDFFSGKGGSSGTGITNFLGSIFSGLHFANGGSPPVGQLSLVGENGPELFMPSSAGTIIPNGALGGDHYTFYIDAKGAAPGSEAAIIRGLQRALEQTRQQSIAGAVDYQRRR